LRAIDPLRSALKVARSVDRTAVHEVDFAVAREALPLARVHEAQPLAAADQPGRCGVVVAAVLARKRNTN